jgi:hypothetical protein
MLLERGVASADRLTRFFFVMPFMYIVFLLLRIYSKPIFGIEI